MIPRGPENAPPQAYKVILQILDDPKRPESGIRDNFSLLSLKASHHTMSMRRLNNGWITRMR